MNNPNTKLSVRMERILLKTQGYNFTTTYTKSSENISVFLSRHPLDQTVRTDSPERYVNSVASYAVPNAMSIDDFKNSYCRRSNITEVNKVNKVD